MLFNLNGKRTKYSPKTFKGIAFTSSLTVIICLTVAFIALLFYNVKTNTKHEINSQSSDNVECANQLNELLENSSRICMFFANYKEMSPMFGHQINTDIQKNTIQENARTFISCFDYIVGIEVISPNFTVTYGNTAADGSKPLPQYNSFNMYSSGDDVYPPSIQIQYVSQNISEYNVRIFLSSIYISQHYINGDNTFLIDRESGKILLSKNTQLINRSINDEYTGLDIANGTSRRYVLSHDQISKSELTVVSLQSKGLILKKTVSSVLMLLLLFLLIASISINIIYRILSHIYRPIENVAEILKYYMPSNNAFIENDSAFIEQLSQKDSFNENIRAALLQIKKGQLYTLHSQISPHMLGNTLEIVKWQVIDKIGYGSNIEKSLNTMGVFLNEAYQYHSLITDIGNEIERTKLYTEMVVPLFYKSLKIEWNVDPDILNCAIIRFTLQPLIENSITHAFRHTETEPKIVIEIHGDKNLIYINIRDNGMGMSPQVLNSIKHSLKDDDEISDKHIGIKNSHLKLKLLFGEDYGIKSIQSDNNGTRLLIEFPRYNYPT